MLIGVVVVPYVACNLSLKLRVVGCERNSIAICCSLAEKVITRALPVKSLVYNRITYQVAFCDCRQLTPRWLAQT